jgi:hypothetical protein
VVEPLLDHDRGDELIGRIDLDAVGAPLVTDRYFG